ncbi:phosphatidylglycerophosphate synthase [Candidatus Nitrososphaera evergladensis SR1]|uniref:Phosphatidylglycerophosphate synthase n=1 Tax=Candidatus Nitrososphaera evergladensis SR1 TaxID=1459636 RepID=A0A075MS42_9ARCH|nr:CDP-alcohol phosphatidyltransferase family protein [Candidatus Nitrososphaera evergladensis]AIF83983.1 phosphatidylglycerophosphate synthase [Candidatus Nitrososphaera evergladensis SR1]
MLNRLRDSLQPTMEKLGSGFASTGLSANFWTGVGLALALAAGVAYASASFGFGIDKYPAAVIGGVLLLVSGFFDMIDGAVARATKQASKKGAFLDSSFDKIAEVVIFIGIAVGGLANPVWCMVGLGMSLLVSYTRARAESLGVELKGIGIGERAERMLILAIIGFIPYDGMANDGAPDWAVIIVSIVAGITLVQRIVATAKKL